MMYAALSYNFAVCAGLYTGSAKYGLTGLSSRWIVQQGQTGFFARGGFFCFVFFPQRK
jgi:hypothetical protein